MPLPEPGRPGCIPSLSARHRAEDLRAPGSAVGELSVGISYSISPARSSVLAVKAEAMAPAELSVMGNRWPLVSSCSRRAAAAGATSGSGGGSLSPPIASSWASTTGLQVGLQRHQLRLHDGEVACGGVDGRQQSIADLANVCWT